MSVQAPVIKSFMSGMLSKLSVIKGMWNTKPKVATIRLSGVIADTAVRKKGLSYPKLVKLIDKAFDKSHVAVALVINSPGGSAAQSSLIASHIRQRAKEKGIPVLSFIEDVAASGGYWLACAGDTIYAQPSSIVGSIGVISASFGFEDFIEKYGIKRRVYTSGSDKSFLDPFLDEKDKDVKRLKQAQKDIHNNFINWVQERRGDRLKGTKKTIFEGQFWTGNEAVELGLIDGIGDIRSQMQERFGTKVRFNDFSPDKKGFFPFSLLRSYNFNLGYDWAENLLECIESRAQWTKYGL